MVSFHYSSISSTLFGRQNRNLLEDVASSESERWGSAVNVVPVVIGVGHSQVASVLVAVAVRVADQRCLVVVVDVAVGDGDPVAGVGDINKAVVVVLPVVQVAGDVDVVNPDVLGGLDGDGVTIVGQDLGNLQVADNDVGLSIDGKTNTSKACTLGQRFFWSVVEDNLDTH